MNGKAAPPSQNQHGDIGGHSYCSSSLPSSHSIEIGAERHQPLEVAWLDGGLDHHPPGRVAAYNVAGFKGCLGLAYLPPALPAPLVARFPAQHWGKKDQQIVKGIFALGDGGGRGAEWADVRPS